MFFLLILACATAAAAGALAVRRRFSSRQAARAGMAVAMVVAGVSHLVMPTPFIQHLPAWVPAREAIVAGTGLMEIALGAGLLLRQPLRRTAGLLLAAYLVLVLPGNVYVAVAGVDVDGQPGGIYPWLRLPSRPSSSRGPFGAPTTAVRRKMLGTVGQALVQSGRDDLSYEHAAEVLAADAGSRASALRRRDHRRFRRSSW